MAAYQDYVSALAVQPILWFRFDNTSSSTTAINSGTSAPSSVSGFGAGSWWQTTGGKDTGYFNNVSNTFNPSTLAPIPSLLNYTFSFWIKRNLPGVGSYAGTSPIGFSSLSGSYKNTSGTDSSIESDGRWYYKHVHGDVGHTDIVSSDLRTGQWIHITYVRASNVVKWFENGVLKTTVTNAGTAAFTGTGNWTFSHAGYGGTGLDEVLLFNYAMTDAAVTALYNHAPASTNAGYTAQVTTATALFVDPTVIRGVNFVETPATATNGHFPEPVISTTRGISYGTEPLTASATILVLSISGNANYQHSFAPATAILTEPTIIITTNDNTEVFTSITATALMVNPSSVVASINISNSSGVTTASADIGTHNIIAGVSKSFVAEEATASALFVEPFRVGPDDNTEIASPFIASVTTGTNTVTVPTSQFNFVKRNNPLLYIRDYSGGNGTLLNEGSLNFGTVDKGLTGSTNWSITQQPSGIPLEFVGNGTSPSIKQPVSDNQGRFRYTDSTFWRSAISQMYADKSFTHEFWYKPVNIYSASGAFNSYISYLDGCFNYTMTHTPTSVSFATSLAVTGGGTVTFNASGSTSLLTNQTWHHIVVLAEPVGATQMKIGYYIDGALLETSTQTMTFSQAQIETRLTGQALTFNMYVGSDTYYGSYDELAIYPNTLSNSEITQHFNFINTLSPNRLILADDFTAEAQSLDASILVVSNKIIPETPTTATCLFVDPLIRVSRTISATAITASALSVNPSFYGTPDYRKNAIPMVASAEKGNNSFALDGTYYSYVQLNIAPFRYVSFDAQDPYMDHGSDNDYSVTPTSVGGTITTAANGINNKSAKTAGINYTTDGVILKESEWNDNWATGQNTNHSSFWVQRQGNDTSSSGIRILWNLNGYIDDQHAILYQYQNKLYLHFNNKTGTQVTQATVSDINLFDYERHHVVIVFDHTNNSTNSVKLYVDAALVMTVNLGSYVVTTTNYSTSYSANSETFNKARLGIGCLITPFASTVLASEPVNTKLFIDEIHWAVTSLNQTQVTNLYNTMPIKDNVDWYADVFLALNSTFVNPTFGTGNTRTATALTASATIVQPQISVVFNKIINATPITATALKVLPSFFGDNITNIVRPASFMLASAFITVPVVTITIPGQPMLATLTFATSTNPYLDDYRLLILDQTLFQTFNVGSFGGSYAIGDID